MFADVEELMQAIDKFKSSIANTEALVVSLESVSRDLEQLDVKYQESQAQHRQHAEQIHKVDERAEMMQAAISALNDRVERVYGQTEVTRVALMSLTDQVEKVCDQAEMTRMVLISLTSQVETLAKSSRRIVLGVIGVALVCIANLASRFI